MLKIMILIVIPSLKEVLNFQLSCQLLKKILFYLKLLQLVVFKHLYLLQILTNFIQLIFGLNFMI